MLLLMQLFELHQNLSGVEIYLLHVPDEEIQQPHQLLKFFSFFYFFLLQTVCFVLHCNAEKENYPEKLKIYFDVKVQYVLF